MGGAFGNPADIRITDDLVLELFPEDEMLKRWINLARERVRFQGLPATYLLARLRRASLVR